MMSPLKANVLIDDTVNTISVSVSNKSLKSIRSINVYLESTLFETLRVLVGHYGVIPILDEYGLVRLDDDESIAVCKAKTLAGCQAAALADYVRRTGLELVDDHQ